MSLSPGTGLSREPEVDGTPRLSRLFPGYFGSDSTDYTCAIGSMFLISMVARILVPGCKAVTRPVIEGRQVVF